MKRRFFLRAAPAIVAAPSLMKVSAAVLPKRWKPEDFHALIARKMAEAEKEMEASMRRLLDDMWSNGTSDPKFGLAALLTDDARSSAVSTEARLRGGTATAPSSSRKETRWT